MQRGIAIALVAGVLVGVLVGFLGWGRPLQRARDDLKALKDQQVAAEVAREELKAAQAKLKKTEDELRLDRERLAQLEAIVSQGKK